MPTLDDVIFRFIGQDQLSGTLLTIAQSMGLVDQNAKGAIESTGRLGPMLSGLVTMGAGVGILAGTFLEAKSAIDTATEAQQNNRVFTIALGKSVGDTNQVMQQWNGTLTQVESDTAQSTITITNMADEFAIAGIRNQTTMKNTLEMASADAYMTGKSVDSVGSAFERMILSGKVMPKTLATYGLSMQDLGVTTKQFAADTAEERATIIDSAVAKKGGVQANKSYADSYQGMIQLISNAWENFQISVGNSLLPVVIPILRLFATALGWIAHGIQLIPGPLLALGIGIIAVIGIVLTAVGAMLVWAPISEFLASTLGTTTGIIDIMSASINLLIPSMDDLTASMMDTTTESTYMGVAIGGEATGWNILAGSIWGSTDAMIAFLFTTPVGWLILLGVAIAGVITYFGWWPSVINDVKIAMNLLWHGLQEGAKDIANFIMNFTTIGQVIKFLQELSVAWGQFLKTAEGKQVLADWGFILQNVSHFLTMLYIGIVQTGDAITRWLDGPVKQTGPATDKAGKSINNVGQIVNGLIWIFGGVTYAGHALLSMFQAFYTLGVVVSNDIGIVVKAFQKLYCIIKGCSPGLIPALGLLQDAINIVMIPIKYFGNLILSIGLIVLATVNLILQHFGLMPVNITQIMNMVWTVINTVWNLIKVLFLATQTTILQPVINQFQWMYTTITTVMNDINNIITTILNTMGSTFGTFATNAASAINTVANTINSALGGAVSILEKIYCRLVGCSPGLVPAFKLLGKTIPEEVNNIMPHLNKLNAALPSSHISFGSLPGGIGAGAIGGSTYNSSGDNSVIHHNETININGSKLTTAEMKEILIEVYEGR